MCDVCYIFSQRLYSVLVSACTCVCVYVCESECEYVCVCVCVAQLKTEKYDNEINQAKLICN